MTPEMTRKIDSVLDRVKDPESNLPIAQLGVVKRLRYDEEKRALYIFTDFYSHLPRCVTCAAIARTIASTIIRDLRIEFEKEFPDLSIEFV
jgi:metal-sulfur cluster biosynthetic enzyme